MCSITSCMRARGCEHQLAAGSRWHAAAAMCSTKLYPAGQVGAGISSLQAAGSLQLHQCAAALCLRGTGMQP